MIAVIRRYCVLNCVLNWRAVYRCEKMCCLLASRICHFCRSHDCYPIAVSVKNLISLQLCLGVVVRSILRKLVRMLLYRFQARCCVELSTHSEPPFYHVAGARFVQSFIIHCRIKFFIYHRYWEVSLPWLIQEFQRALTLAVEIGWRGSQAALAAKRSTFLSQGQKGKTSRIHNKYTDK